MVKNQSNKEFLEILIGSGVSFFTKNQPNNYYFLKTKYPTISTISYFFFTYYYKYIIKFHSILI